MRYALALFLSLPLHAMAADKVPILLDTDIGNDIDDAFALALAVNSPELDIRAITTCAKGAEDRAWIVCRLLTAIEKRTIPVAWGREPQPGDKMTTQFQYRYHPAPLFNRTAKPVKDSAAEVLYAKLKAEPGKLTIVALGPLTNIAKLLEEHPDCKPWIKRIVLMGGSIRIGYDGAKKAEPEWNIKTDVKAARVVFQTGVPLTVAPLDATSTLTLEGDALKKLFAACTPLTMQVQSLFQLWDKPTPILFDPVAVALAIDERFCTMEDLHLEVDDQGMTGVGMGKPNARVAMSIKADEFRKWFIERVAAGEAVLPRAPTNPSKLIANDTKLPNRVHAFEDFETDIERRWWMSGKEETKVVGNGKRSCRSVLTQDFDDKMGDTKTMYSAVIFNPVPGPPMGKNPRLRFRYYLKGTDTLRVQIYSLSKGYHRCLTLNGLPQEKWQLGTVDMTQVRKPDGSGGPLSEDERIDDIQFYVDPRAEVLIDDIVLYDAPLEDEKLAFPERIHFTGWFDTGKQGKEWPGTYEIVEKEGYFWKAARAVTEGQSNIIRLNLRGQRQLEPETQLTFRYRIKGGDRLSLTHQLNEPWISVHDLKQGEWARVTLDYPIEKRPSTNEILLYVRKGVELLIDDLLLYTPSKP